jgi:hypothetical protein
LPIFWTNSLSQPFNSRCPAFDRKRAAGARTALGPRGEQIGQIRQDLAAVRETGSVVWEPYFLGLLADAYVQDGQVGAGLPTLDEALAAPARETEGGA